MEHHRIWYQYSMYATIAIDPTVVLLVDAIVVLRVQVEDVVQVVVRLALAVDREVAQERLQHVLRLQVHQVPGQELTEEQLQRMHHEHLHRDAPFRRWRLLTNLFRSEPSSALLPVSIVLPVNA